MTTDNICCCSGFEVEPNEGYESLDGDESSQETETLSFYRYPCFIPVSSWGQFCGLSVGDPELVEAELFRLSADETGLHMCAVSWPRTTTWYQRGTP